MPGRENTRKPSEKRKCHEKENYDQPKPKSFSKLGIADNWVLYKTGGFYYITGTACAGDRIIMFAFDESLSSLTDAPDWGF